MESCLLVSELSDIRVGPQEIQLHNNCLNTLSQVDLFLCFSCLVIPQLAALKALGLIYYADKCDLSLREVPGEGLWRWLHS